MATRGNQRFPESVYSRAKILAEVEDRRKRLGWEPKGIAMEIGMGTTPARAQANWYLHSGGRETPFTVEQLGRLAAVFDAPRLWPFASWEELETLYDKKFPGLTREQWEKKKSGR